MAAAVAAALCLGVLHPHSSGIGGGAFAVVRLANGTSEAIEFREEAPAAAAAEHVRRALPTRRSRAASPSRCPRRFTVYAWRGSDTARSPWSRLVRPAATLAEGFPWVPNSRAPSRKTRSANFVPRRRRRRVSSARDRRSPFASETRAPTPRSRERFAPSRPKVPTRFERPLAEALARDVREAGGVMTADDGGIGRGLGAHRPRRSDSTSSGCLRPRAAARRWRR